MKHTKSGGLFTELVLEVFRLNGTLLASGDEMTADFGLTSARWQVMGMIDGQALPVPHIARQMGLTRQGVQRTVNVLEKEGLVELQLNPNHKTAKLVQLSKEGRRRLDQVADVQSNWANQMSENYPLTDLQGGLHLIRQLRNELEEKS